MTRRPASNRSRSERRALAAAATVALGVALPTVADTAPGPPADATAGFEAWRRGDVEAAQLAWREAAEAGSAHAAYDLGLTLLERDPAAAETWLARAADAGHTLACFALGTRLAARDPDRAEALLTTAARSGYVPAQHNLATLLLRAGREDEARPWLRAAAVTFEPSAQALAALPPATPEPAAGPAPALPAADAIPAAAAPDDTPGRVHDLDWVLAQPPERYTLQVAAAAREAPLRRLLERHAGTLPSAAFMHRPGASEPLSAVLGSFDSLAGARAALSSLPDALGANAPWIRRFGTLQTEIRERQRSRDDAAGAEPDA